VDLDIKESKSETEEKSDEEEEETSEKVDNIKLFVFHSGKFSFYSRMCKCCGSGIRGLF
jgi:hypothetical protein